MILHTQSISSERISSERLMICKQTFYIHSTLKDNFTIHCHITSAVNILTMGVKETKIYVYFSFFFLRLIYKPHADLFLFFLHFYNEWIMAKHWSYMTEKVYALPFLLSSKACSKKISKYLNINAEWCIKVIEYQLEWLQI